MSVHGHASKQSTEAEGGLDIDRAIRVPLQHILVPMDSTIMSQQALERLMPIVHCCGATVHVLFVRWDPGPLAFQRDRLRFDPDTDLKQLAERFKAKMRDHGIEVVIANREGIPHRAILSYVVDNNIDLIIMSTHGRTGLNRFLQGSVTEQVIRDSPVPVMAMRYEG